MINFDPTSVTEDRFPPPEVNAPAPTAIVAAVAAVDIILLRTRPPSPFPTYLLVIQKHEHVEKITTKSNINIEPGSYDIFDLYTYVFTPHIMCSRILRVVEQKPTFKSVPNHTDNCFSKQGRIENANAKGPIMRNILNIITVNPAIRT